MEPEDSLPCFTRAHCETHPQSEATTTHLPNRFA